MTQEDAVLVCRARQGDQEACGGLVQKYRNLIYGLCFHFVGNFADAEDLAHDAFLEAFVKLEQLREPAKFGNWLRTIAANLCKRWLARRGRVVLLDDADETELQRALEERHVPTPEEELEKKMLQEDVRIALNALPEQNRLVLTLYYMDGLSYAEIAGFLEVPRGTVMSRMHRAKRQLREEMISMVQRNLQDAKLPPDFTQRVRQDTEALRGCAANLQAIWKGIAAHKEEHGDVPDWLSDLFPKYLTDKAILLCPSDTTGGTTKYYTERSCDPKLPCSYSYQFNGGGKDIDVYSPKEGNWSDLGQSTWKAAKLLQVEWYGNIVPLIRCYHHVPMHPLVNLSYGGDVYLSGMGWELEADVIREQIKSQ